MTYLLDTNILIYLIKNNPPAVAERVNALGAEDRLAMSFVTYAELLLGAERSNRRERVIQRLERLKQEIAVLYPDNPSICHCYAEQRAALKAAGTPIGANDLWIAAHALAEGATVVTNNRREFSRVEGLAIENWVS